MGKILWAVLAVVIVAAAGFYFLQNGGTTGFLTKANPQPNQEQTTFLQEGLAYGSNIDALDANGTDWSPKYVVIWAGTWIQSDPYGWQTFNGWLDRIRAEGATPVVLWYYWGNDTTTEKITAGVDGKSVEDWYDMTARIGESIDNIMGDRGAIVVIEPEFNKNDMEGFTDFNQNLIEVTRILHEKNSNIKVAIGFGNWNHDKWRNFEGAVNAADIVGYQGVVKLPGNTLEEYGSLVDRSITASQFLQTSFPGKPIIWYDFGASSEGAEDGQRAVVAEMFEKSSLLEDAGTRIVIYRHFIDVTQFNEPEDRNWGLLEEDGTEKPAYAAWIGGVNSQVEVA